ncbi:MAG: hypothetical protein E7660_02645 [Ruminococcaceae bacterium]|nr:hypothetical protein [Oscillospiraceae bacterium]
MKKAVLDLTGCKYWHELHKRIKKTLEFPDYYGENLDAFWDCINRDCDVDFLTVVGSSTVASELKPTVDSILGMLEENKQFWKDTECPFNYEILS